MWGMNLRGIKVSYRALAATIVLAAGTTASVPAQAQWGGWFGRGGYAEQPAMPPGVLYRQLARQGYRATTAAQRRGDVVIVDVEDRYGQPMRLIVDAMDGSILQRFATGQPATASVYGYNADPRPAYRASPETLPPRRADLTPPGSFEPAPLRRAEPAPERQHVPKPKVASRPSSTHPRALPNPLTPSEPPAEAPREPSVAAMPVEPAPKAKSAPTVRPAAVTAAPTPTEATPPPKTKTAPARSKPGYANGVPINPLE
jgi:hypothetical protein